MAVKFAIGYWFSGGLLVLAVVIAARVDIQIVEFVAERIKLMFRSAGSDLPDEIAERICLRHRVWCNKEAEASVVAGRSAAHGPCREPHPSPVSGGRRAAPLSHRQMRILSVGLVGWPRTDVWSAASGGAET